MLIFLIVLLLLAAAVEVYSLYDSLKHVSYRCDLNVNRAEPGAELLVTATVSNTSRLPISYIRCDARYPLSARLPEGMECTEGRFDKTGRSTYRLWGRQRVRRSIAVTIEKRGLHSFNGALLQRGDFLGLKETQREYNQPCQVLIYPKRLNSRALNNALGSYCGDVIAQRWLIRDPIITMGIREYTGREAMKTISWSQSARRGELMVREFDYTRQPSCTVVLCANGIGPGEGDKMDKCCSISRTVCEDLVTRGIAARFISNAPQAGYYQKGVTLITASAGRTDALLEVLARLSASWNGPVSSLISECGTLHEDGEVYVLVSPSRTPAVEEARRALSRLSGGDVLLIAADEVEED